MEYLLTNAQMRRADEYTIKTLGVESLTLMERAGNALATQAEELLDLRGKRIRERVLCVCGGGNNGGDGFVCARVLRTRGVDTDVVFFAEKTSAECAENLKRYQETGGRILEKVPTLGYAVVVDCLLGTGFHGELSTAYRAAVDGVNALKSAGAKVLAADIPSGINGDNGSRASACVCADRTLCIGEKKAGVYLGEGIDFAGETVRADIGISLPETKYAKLIDDETARAFLPKRKRYSNKGSYGKAAIVGGNIAYTGAVALSTAACLRSGAGYTTLFVPQGILPYYVLKYPETLLRPISTGDEIAFEKESFESLLAFDSVAFGMGAGVSQAVADGAVFLLENYTGKLVLDADALNSLAAYKKDGLCSILRQAKCDVVLTPHIKEFARLTDMSVAEIVERGLSAGEEFFAQTGATLLLKNAVSVIYGKDGIFVNAAGNSGQAKGGSGDVLAGVLAGLLAQGCDSQKAAVCAAYIVGKAAEKAALDMDEYAITASELIAYMGRAFANINNPKNV